MNNKEIMDMKKGFLLFVESGEYQRIISHLRGLDYSEEDEPIFGHSFSSMVGELKVASRGIRKKKTIAQYINKFLEEKNIKRHSYVYNKAGIDRFHWNDLKNGIIKKPELVTLYKLAIGFELTLEEARKFLKNFNYTFDEEGSVLDMVIVYALKSEIYNKCKIDQLLYELDEETIFSIK